MLAGSAGWRLCSSECVGAKREAGELGKGTHTRPADCTVSAPIKVPTLSHHASLPSHPRAAHLWSQCGRPCWAVLTLHFPSHT